MCEKTKKEMDHIRDRDLHGGDHYDLVILFSDFKGKSKCRKRKDEYGTCKENGFNEISQCNRNTGKRQVENGDGQNK